MSADRPRPLEGQVDPESHRGWRDHPRHREAMRHGIADYYEEYSIAVGETTYASAFTRT